MKENIEKKENLDMSSFISTIGNNKTIKSIEDSSLITAIIAGLLILLIVLISKKFNSAITKIYYYLLAIFKTEPYEVLNLRKHATVCHNGHIIVLHDFTLKINHKTSEKFSRMFDVSDASNKCQLPNLKSMISTKKEKRFTNYGFWYHSNPENIFDEVKETDPSSNNYRQRKFYFRFNKARLKTLSTNKIKLMYGYSIKHGQPIVNGYFDRTLIKSQDRESSIVSGFLVRYKMDTLEYIFSFEDVVKIKEDNISVYYYPKGEDYEHLKKELKYEKKDDLYYNKFLVKINKPKINSLIKIEVPIEPK